MTRASGFVVEHQCPQCGAPATLEETDRLFSCGYCRVRSFLSSHLFRYVLPHRTPPGKELVFLPYWRFKGMFFTCSSAQVRHQIVDVSRQAQPLAPFPPSLGLRSQTLKLRFLDPETEGRFLAPTLSRKAMLEDIEERFGDAGSRRTYEERFIGESISQIYAPFYVEGRVYDAVLDEPVSGDLPPEFDLLALPEERPRWRLRFLPALCPGCGWDLEGERDSIALACRNCDSLWKGAGGRFLRLSFGHLSDEGGGQPVEYLPFWRIQAEVRGVELRSYADLVRLANLPCVVQPGWEALPFRFWVPAFKIRPKDFLRCAGRLTVAQPSGEATGLPEGPVHPVTLPVTEAVESLKIVLAPHLKPERVLLPKLPEIRIRPRGFALVYVPFRGGRMELIHDRYQLCVHRNVLSFARHL